ETWPPVTNAQPRLGWVLLQHDPDAGAPSVTQRVMQRLLGDAQHCQFLSRRQAEHAMDPNLDGSAVRSAQRLDVVTTHRLHPLPPPPPELLRAQAIPQRPPLFDPGSRPFLEPAQRRSRIGVACLKSGRPCLVHHAEEAL